MTSSLARIMRACALLTVVITASACGHGDTAPDESGSGTPGTFGGVFDPSDETLGGSHGDLGVTTISTQTQNYDVVVSIGETASVGMTESENGHYTIEGAMSF